MKFPKKTIRFSNVEPGETFTTFLHPDDDKPVTCIRVSGTITLSGVKNAVIISGPLKMRRMIYCTDGAEVEVRRYPR